MTVQQPTPHRCHRDDPTLDTFTRAQLEAYGAARDKAAVNAIVDWLHDYTRAAPRTTGDAAAAFAQIIQRGEHVARTGGEG